MINVRIEEKPAFSILGQKVWISGQNSSQFERFWSESKRNGLVERLRAYNGNRPGPVTGATTFGVSRVEKDPNNRAFFFYIAAEARDEADALLERYTVPACRWAIFVNRGALPESLIDAEMYCFLQWLPASPYRHANAPELEVYPARDDSLVEYWLPIEEK